MAHTPKISNAAAEAAAEAVVALCNTGTLRIYDGTKPATADTAAGGDTHILAELTFAATAKGSGSNGVVAFAAITEDSDANATGTASWFRAFKSDGTSPVFDGTAGVTGGGFDLEMPTTSIVQHAEVTVSSLTYTASEG